MTPYSLSDFYFLKQTCSLRYCGQDFLPNCWLCSTILQCVTLKGNATVGSAAPSYSVSHCRGMQLMVPQHHPTVCHIAGECNCWLCSTILQRVTLKGNATVGSAAPSYSVSHCGGMQLLVLQHHPTVCHIAGECNCTQNSTIEILTAHRIQRLKS